MLGVSTIFESWIQVFTALLIKEDVDADQNLSPRNSSCFGNFCLNVVFMHLNVLSLPDFTINPDGDFTGNVVVANQNVRLFHR